MSEMGEMTFAEALALFKAEENKEVAALVLQDKALQSVIACWPMVSRCVPVSVPVSDSSADMWAVLWSAVEFDEREVVELSGLSSGIGIAAFRRAKGNRLVYPDGSVHQLARGVLQKMLKDALKS